MAWNWFSPAGEKQVVPPFLKLDQRQMMRDVSEGPDAALWVLTDDPSEGRVIRLPARGK